MTRNEENIIKEQSSVSPPPPSNAKPFPRTKDITRTQVAASFHERGKENQSNYIGNRNTDTMELLTKIAKKQHIILVSWQRVIAFDQ
jgi:hypothetical protein